MLIDARMSQQLDELRDKWQDLLDVLQCVTGVPAALVMRVHSDQIEVFSSSGNPANVYERGERAELGTGLYCETVMRTRSELLVPDATKDPAWDHNPDIEVGMISYLGLPVTWPSGQMFGTICVLDTSENMYSQTYRRLLHQFRGAVERDLAAIVREAELRRSKAELEQQGEALERANAELEQFAYAVSHDLSEPLRTVNWFVTRLVRRVEETLPGEDVRQWTDFIIDATDRMRQMIDDLLALSRVGRADSTDADVPLDEVVADLLPLLAPAAAESGARIDVADLPVVHASRTQLSQLLRNLVANAVKFARPGVAPVVAISAAQRPDRMWEVRVDDNGIGIPPEHRERIFTIFQRLHPRDEYSGTGVGLAICKKIVESNGGHIWVEDSPLGGAGFRFTVAGGRGKARLDLVGAGRPGEG